MSSNNNPSHAEAVEKLEELIKEIKFCMLTTVESDGSLRSRPMTSQLKDFDGTLWFFTGASDAKSQEIAHEHHVNLSYADPGDNKYVSVSGTAQVVRDSQKAKELWNPMYKAWFPGGLDDPNLALLRVTVDHAEYWDSPSSPVAHVLGFARAIVTGQRYQPDDSEHQKLDLKK